jgi:hypothetical protein
MGKGAALQVNSPAKVALGVSPHLGMLRDSIRTHRLLCLEASRLRPLRLTVVENMLHLVRLVPHSLLHESPESSHVQVLKRLQVNAILCVNLVTELARRPRKSVAPFLVEESFVRHIFNNDPGRRLSDLLILHGPAYLTYEVSLRKSLLRWMIVA